MDKLAKIQMVFQELPKNTAAIMFNKFSTGKPNSGNVVKMLKILDGLNDLDKKEFYIYAQEKLNAICNSLFDEKDESKDESNNTTEESVE